MSQTKESVVFSLQNSQSECNLNENAGFGLFWGCIGIEWSEICPRFARKTNWICCCLTLQVLFTFIFFISINSMYIIHSKLHVKHSLNAPVALAVDNAIHQRHLRSIHNCWSPQTRWNITKDILLHIRACLCSKLPSHYFPISSNQLAVLLTERGTAKQNLTWFYISITGNSQ